MELIHIIVLILLTFFTYDANYHAAWWMPLKNTSISDLKAFIFLMYNDVDDEECMLPLSAPYREVIMPQSDHSPLFS